MGKENIILTDKEKEIYGNRWAEILQLKEDQEYNRKSGNNDMDKKRYLTSWGNKSAIGIYEVIKRLVKESEA